jgi:hypothetical protein
MIIPIKEPSEYMQRKELTKMVKPLWRLINRRRYELWNEIEEAYKQTGFPFPAYQGDPSESKEALESLLAWDTLPHQYVQSKLLEIDYWQARIDDAIDRLDIGAVKDGLHQLSDIATRVFSEVEEFLDSPLSRMKKEEWERQPSWVDKLYSPSLSWKIGGIPMFENRISKRRIAVGDEVYALHN